MKDYPNIYLTKFLFNLEALEDMLLPEYKGSTVRGAFGWEFKNTVGPLEPVFDFVFDSKAEGDLPKELEGVKKVPHPLIIEPPIFHKRNISKGEVFTITLTVIGESDNFTPFFVQTIKNMGRKGLTSKGKHLKLVNVFNIAADDSLHLIYEDYKSVLKTAYKRITLKQILSKINYSSNIIKLDFQTPFNIQKDGKELIGEMEIKSLTPEIIIENLERRFRHLAWLYCNSKFEKQIFDVSEIKISKTNLSEFKLIRKKNNNINKDKTSEIFYGLIGNIVLEGNLSNILPLIYVGEQIHFGKKTSFGFGKYNILNL